ncbi:MAG: chemotaxis protein CheX [Planctomycetota bacterium]|jgi:CheY-specific phosphatase CheX
MMTACEGALEAWAKAAVEAVKEFAGTALGIDEVEVKGYQAGVPEGGISSYLAMVSLDQSFRIGLSSNHVGCRKLAAALMSMGPGEEETLDYEDITDAIGEVINIVAGMVKRRMGVSNPTVSLGLPVFSEGGIEPVPHQEVGFVELVIGDVPARVLMIRRAATVGERCSRTRSEG